MGQSFSRRQAVQSVAALFPTVVPASAAHRLGQTPPNSRISVGFIGCGKMANDYHISTLVGFEDIQCVAVCDVDRTRMMAAKKRIDDAYAKAGRVPGSVAAFRDYRDLVARKDIDAVVIASPEHWHAAQIIHACAAGKDVYCEKPLVLTLEEGKRVVEAARKHKRVVQTGSQQRSNVFGPFRQAVELVRSGRLGKISKVTVGVGGPSVPCDLPGEPMEPGLDWDLWLGPAPLREYSSVLSPRGVHNHFPAWRSYREYAGGGHSDIGAHHYDIAQWALDMDHTGPVEIIPPDDPKATSGMRYLYANGIEMVHGGVSGCEFTGTNGTLHIDRGVLESSPASLVEDPLTEKDVRLYKSPGHHRNWVDCMRSREKPIADIEIGARTVSIITLGNLAYWNHRKLKWDPKAWRIVGDREAEGWMNPERRKGYALPRG